MPNKWKHDICKITVKINFFEENLSGNHRKITILKKRRKYQTWDTYKNQIKSLKLKYIYIYKQWDVMT